MRIMMPNGANIPVYNVEAMKMLQSTEKLRGIKSTPGFIELPLALKMIE